MTLKENNKIVSDYLQDCGYELVTSRHTSAGELSVYHNWQKTVVVITKSNGFQTLLKEVDLTTL